MKKTVRTVLSLLLACTLLVLAVPVSAASVTVSYSLDGAVYKTQAVDGTVTLPDKPNATGVFVGWTAEIDGVKRLYPKGASVAVTEDTEFAALFISYETCDGASARVVNGDVSLRFTSMIAKADYDLLVGLLGEDALSFGTYITAKDYLYKTSFVFTLDALRAAGCDKYLDVPAGGFYKTDKDGYYIAGSVAHILSENYSRAYAGIGYLKLTYSDGSEGTVYSDFHYADNSRNIYDVVFSAYEDRNPDYDYIVPIGTHGSTYSASHSPYTVSQLDTMKTFLDSVAAVKITTGKDGLLVYSARAGEYYASPWRVVYEINEYEDATITVTPPDGVPLSSLKALFFGGSRMALDADRVTVTDTTVVIEHSSYSKPY